MMRELTTHTVFDRIAVVEGIYKYLRYYCVEEIDYKNYFIPYGELT
jgi:hypothetical protein